MQTVTTIHALRTLIKQWRRQGDTVALVPTMGNLHDGHIQLVSQARQRATKVIVSIFVNPTQFGPNEDFEAYPRTETADQAKLEQAAVDLLFLPAVVEMYPVRQLTTVHVEGLSGLHCGVSRQGHFAGVATVVGKLFNIVQPDSAWFGEKDFQQLTIIRRMVEQLNFPIDIVGVPTVREGDGLAMSSRNAYLTPEQRATAAALFQVLCAAKRDILNENGTYSDIEERYGQTLAQLGFLVDYLRICRCNDLLPASEGDTELVILAAAKLGRARLIDNIRVLKQGSSVALP